MDLIARKRSHVLTSVALLLIVGLGPSGVASAKGTGPSVSQVDAAAACQWVHVSVPQVNGLLSAVGVTSQRQAWAVGFRLVPDNLAPLVMRFDGSAWSQVAVSPAYGRLNAIADVSPVDVWAVGQDGDGATMALHFDGADWTRLRTPSRGIFAYFLGVAAPAADDVWAVGDWEDAHLHFHPLLEHWDGKTWRIVRVADGAFFEGVSASSSSDVWAVGSGFGGGSVPFFHFDGVSWTAVPGPSLDDPYSLYGVHAVGPDSAWTVGYRVSDGGSGPDRPLVLRWDGTQWASAGTPSLTALLLSIDVRPRGRPVAVGYVEDPETTTFVVRKQRGSFVQVPSWNRPHGTYSILNGVSIGSRSGTAWAVGGSGLESGEVRPVIERQACSR